MSEIIFLKLMSACGLLLHKEVSILLGMIKKCLKIIVSAALTSSILSITTVHAEDYSDTDYWNSRCMSDNIKTADDFNACKAYTEYVASQTPSLQAQLDEINAQKTSIEANISEYQDELDTYQGQVDTLNSSIGDLEAVQTSIEADITAAQSEIEQKQKDIDAAQTTIDGMSEKIKERMVNAQSSLRINNMIDVLMGAKTFSDFIRIAAGIASITAKEKSENEELVAAMEKLHDAQNVLEDAKQKLAAQEEELKTQEEKIQTEREEVLVAQYKVQVIQSAARSQEALLQAQGNHIASNISDVQATMTSISSSLDALQESIFAPTPAPTPTPEETTDPNATATATPAPTVTPVSTGWARPVYGSYRSAGTWEYPDGGVHLGYDFAVASGTTLYAAGTGVILNSVSGCPVGYLGSRCGEDGGGYGGGNQLYLLCVVDGSLYGLIYCHMTDGTLVSKGTIVHAGDYVGLSGSSGNSSGPHCHIEVMYLGDGTNFSYYATHWDGDLAYGAGWAGQYDGYGRRCEAGYSAPCRIRPEEIWGY